MSFKILHQFTVTIDREVEEVSTRTENGQEITTKKKVVQPVQVPIVLKDPSRREKQDLSLFQSITHNDAINLGLLPRLIMIQKLAKDANSPISGDDDKTLAALGSRLQELANDYMRIKAQSGPETEEDKARMDRLTVEYMALQKKATDINSAYQSVFAHTAEQYVQGKMLTWLTLYLTYVKKGPDKYEPLFTGADFKAKEEHMGEMEDAEDKLYLTAIDKLPTYWMLYLFGRASKPEEFTKVEEEWKKQMEAAKKLDEEQAAQDAAKSATPAAPPVSEPAPVAPTQP